MGLTGLTLGEIPTATDPALLLDHAWAMEPDLRLNERAAALDRIELLLADGQGPPAPPGRDWNLELRAERAIDAASYMQLLRGREMAEQVLAEARPEAAIARARATLALGRSLVWLGTEDATRRGDRILEDAVAQFSAIGHSEWHGFTVFWRGHAVAYQSGDLPAATTLITEALEILGPDSPRRSSVLTFYADVLTDQGRFPEAEAALDEATEIADRDGYARSRGYAAWSRARLMASLDNPAATERVLREVERDATDWFETMTGLDFLSDAAVQLDRVGLTDQAHDYLHRARARVARDGARADDGVPFDEPLRLAEASILARSGDPGEALEKLQELVRGEWLERRLIWRNTLLTAWATLRAGNREDAATVASQALNEAVANGGIAVAEAGEGLLTRALAPLAAETGSEHARELLTRPEPGFGTPGQRRLIIRLFGTPMAESPDGASLDLPAGKPGELVRMLALYPHGLATEVVLEEFFPAAAPAAARQRLRQVLTRLRAGAGEIVIRDGEVLRLVPAWVDVREFRSLAQRAGASRGSRAVTLSQAALALAGRGPLLASDPYAEWAEETRAAVSADLERLRRPPARG